jgi:hypothetical protein
MQAARIDSNAAFLACVVPRNAFVVGNARRTHFIESSLESESASWTRVSSLMQAQRIRTAVSRLEAASASWVCRSTHRFCGGITWAPNNNAGFPSRSIVCCPLLLQRLGPTEIAVGSAFGNGYCGAIYAVPGLLRSQRQASLVRTCLCLWWWWWWWWYDILYQRSWVRRAPLHAYRSARYCIELAKLRGLRIGHGLEPCLTMDMCAF